MRVWERGEDTIWVWAKDGFIAVALLYTSKTGNDWWRRFPVNDPVRTYTDQSYWKVV